MLPQTFKLIHYPKEFDSNCFGTNQEKQKVLVLYNSHSSLHIDLTPLADFENVRKGFANFTLAYWVGKKKRATTRIRGSIIPTSYDTGILTVTIPIREPVVFTVRDGRVFFDQGV